MYKNRIINYVIVYRVLFVYRYILELGLANSRMISVGRAIKRGLVSVQ